MRTHRVFFAEPTEFAAELSEFSLPKQYCRTTFQTSFITLRTISGTFSDFRGPGDFFEDFSNFLAPRLLLPPQTTYFTSFLLLQELFVCIDLVAPYCATPRDYLNDTPLLCAQPGLLGAMPPPPFLSVSALEGMQRGGAVPPPTKGVSRLYLHDTLLKMANGCDTPLCDTISKRYCVIWGVSRNGLLSA